MSQEFWEVFPRGYTPGGSGGLLAVLSSSHIVSLLLPLLQRGAPPMGDTLP